MLLRAFVEVRSHVRAILQTTQSTVSSQPLPHEFRCRAVNEGGKESRDSDPSAAKSTAKGNIPSVRFPFTAFQNPNATT